MKNLFVLISSLLLFIACVKEQDSEPKPKPKLSYENSKLNPIVVPYAKLTVIDAHNHDACDFAYKNSQAIWEEFSIERIVLFGNISETKAQYTDRLAMDAYKQSPYKYIPFVAGVNIHDSVCLEYIETKFKEGAFGVGEVVAASTYSQINSNLEWKGIHPLDGYFPEIYELCAEYNKPILLHIDPPNGQATAKLREAAKKYPSTNFIFAHANAYNTPAAIRDLLKDYPNIYIDFFAGFTAYNPNSSNELKDFVPIINEYPKSIFCKHRFWC